MAPEAWVKRWSRLDGIITKAFAEETAPFPDESYQSLALFKETYPQKALILHFNGRARLPDFQPETMNAQDYLYFLGSKNASAINTGEDISRIKVDDISRFQRKKNMAENVSDDVVLVPVNVDGSFDWPRSEHARLVSINERHSELTVKRDILKTGQISTQNNRVYIAMHVAKGPFGGNTQRLWEYNWFKAGLDNADNGLAERLSNELATKINTQHPYFDGLVLDVMTEHHTPGIGGYNLKLDINSDGVMDQDLDFDLLHQRGIYRFLAQLRQAVGTNKLLMADGHYLNQRAVGSLNGIESEGWPTSKDPQLTHWSSGLNRHRYWHQFGAEPSFSYMKVVEYFTEDREKVEPDNNIRRLVVAAALLSDSAIIPAIRANGKPFHRWPEFARFNKLGNSLGDSFIVESGNTTTLKNHQIWKEHHWEQEFPSLNSETAVSTKSVCTVLKSDSTERTVILHSTLPPVAKLPASRPGILLAAFENSDVKYSFSGKETFESWFYWDNLTSNKLCLGSDSDLPINIKDITIIDGPMVVARAFENGILLTNISHQHVTLNTAELANKYPSMARFLKNSQSSIQLKPRDVTLLD